MLLLDTIWTRRKKVSDERLVICKGCENFVEKTSKCNMCGCFMEYKSLIMSASCPINKWQPHKE